MELVKPVRAVFIGEGMLELSQDGDAWRLGHGGDTLNTAIHLARAGVSTAYLTSLGADPFSDRLRTAWADEGLDTTMVLTDPTRSAGLYAIATDPQGERSFAYWRSDSAARQLFACDGIDALLERAVEADLIAFSLISLAIIPTEGREQLLQLARTARARGAMVAFDGNYRARLWESPAEARAARDSAIACATIGLPTLEDEIALGGTASLAHVAAHWRDLGCPETVVKLGAQGCLLPDGTTLAPEARLSPVDTSGAGDAFNAGYLAARLSGATFTQAAHRGHRLAGWTIMRRGAIPPRD